MMRRSLIVLEIAELQTAKAARWYERRSSGLGRRFIEHIHAVFEDVVERPEAQRIVHGEIRRARRQPFPYNVFYLVEPTRIVVLRVLHSSRSPKRWPRQRS